MIVMDIQKYITDNLAPYVKVTIDDFVYDEKKLEGIVIQQGRGQPVTNTYMDGSVTGEFNFDIRAITKKAGKAAAWLESVTEHFKGRSDIVLENKAIFTATPVIQPYLIERLNNGGFIYSAAFRVEYDELP